MIFVMFFVIMTMVHGEPCIVSWNSDLVSMLWASVADGLWLAVSTYLTPAWRRCRERVPHPSSPAAAGRCDCSYDGEVLDCATNYVAGCNMYIDDPGVETLPAGLFDGMELGTL